MSKLLLDTCAFLWVAAGEALKEEARQAIEMRQLSVSPITAWELAVLARIGRMAFSEPLESWFRRAIHRLDASLPHLSPELLIASQTLPANSPPDPADRIIIATARELGLVLVTRDRALLRYGESGHLLTMEC